MGENVDKINQFDKLFENKESYILLFHKRGKMNSMFQDSKISLENLKLYRETPEEELVKNVNPFEQR